MFLLKIIASTEFHRCDKFLVYVGLIYFKLKSMRSLNHSSYQTNNMASLNNYLFNLKIIISDACVLPNSK